MSLNSQVRFCARILTAQILTAACAVAASPALADERKASIQGVDDPALRQQIIQAVGEVKDKPQNRFDARRRAREAGETALAVLRSEGYYASDVEPDLGEGDQPAPIVRVTPGKRFVFADPAVAWTGPPPQDEARQAAESVLDLTPGAPGRAAQVLAAEGRVLQSVQQRGYADAAIEPREVTVDHADQTVRPTLRFNAGALVRLDGLEVSGGSVTRRGWLDRLAPWRPGDVYDPEKVAELERRLRDAGVYDSVTVALAGKDKTNADGLRPVIVSLADRPGRTLELGAGYSTTEGAGFDGRLTRYNRFGRGDTLAYTARLAEIEQRAGVQASFAQWRWVQHTLHLGAEVFHEDPKGYESLGLTTRADVTRRLGKISYFTWGASADFSRTQSKIQGEDPTPRNLVTLTGLAALSLDRSDSVLDPKRGWRFEVRAEPTVTTGQTSLLYIRAQAQASAYKPFNTSAATVLAGRVRAGIIDGAGYGDLPATRRFYSGGGGSVRGYAYQAVGPQQDGTPYGGVSLAEVSLELRQKITSQWGVVAFIEGGAVGGAAVPQSDGTIDRTKINFSKAGVAAGLGVRYDLGFGPIRIDIAKPLNPRENDPSFQIYLSIGQSF